MNYEECINKIENNMAILNECHDKLLNKANDIKVKMEMLNKKMNIVDSMQLLTFQNKIIHNELSYLNNMKPIIYQSLNNTLLTSSETITLMTLSVTSMYKNIVGNESKPVKISNKKDNIVKMVGDIKFNLDFLDGLISEIKQHNKILYGTLIDNKFHCNTLDINMDVKCGHIELEYKKNKNDVDKTLEYYVKFTNMMVEQINNMILHNFLL
jgi:hypothetical protein